MIDGQLEFGEALKAEGMRRAELAEPEEWKRRFGAALRWLAGTRREFTTEDALDIVGDWPLHPNVIGSLTNGLARADEIRKVGYRESNRPSRHRAIVAVWTAGPALAAAPRTVHGGSRLGDLSGLAKRSQGSGENLRSA